MPIQFSCPHCGKQTSVDEQYAGHTGPCSTCGQTITIPGGEAKPLPYSAPPPMKSAGAAGGAGAVIGIVAVVCVVGILGCGGILVALLLPAVQAAREAARRTQCSNNMKQVALAFHNYHDTYGTFPPAYIPDEDGNPKHSWRVLILPFVEQSALYDSYDFDEPWDSPTNSAVVNSVVPAYTCPSSPTQATCETHYMVITSPLDGPGPKTVFPGPEGSRIRDITDGTSNTIMVVEVTGTGVNWAEPVDLDASNLNYPLGNGSPNTPGSNHPGGLNAAMCDGSVTFIADTVNPQVFDAMLTRDGGEAIPMGY